MMTFSLSSAKNPVSTIVVKVLMFSQSRSNKCVFLQVEFNEMIASKVQLLDKRVNQLEDEVETLKRQVIQHEIAIREVGSVTRSRLGPVFCDKAEKEERKGNEKV